MNQKKWDNCYNIRWNTQSQNSGESMPVGGHDVGCNVWVENQDMLLYMAQSGCFDEEGRMCKAGRIRLHFDPPVFSEDFLQELKLREGWIEVCGSWQGKKTRAEIWVDTDYSAVRIRMQSEFECTVFCSYESWRSENSALSNRDVIIPEEGRICFYHRNNRSGEMDRRIAEQGLEFMREDFPDVEKNRTFGGVLLFPESQYCGTQTGIYGECPYTGYTLKSIHPTRELEICVLLQQNQANSVQDWLDDLYNFEKNYCALPDRKEAIRNWWEAFWDRSYVCIKSGCTDAYDRDWQTGRNYQLFRYMLGCNAYGEYPTKFNGALFTVDPIYCSRREGFGSVYPDDRDWGGLIFTAQNQRLVYWPMLKNGDFDMMKPQFEFYNRTLPAMKKRTQHFFHLENAACYPEQLDANALSAFYGKYGLDYPLQVRYHHSTALEFVLMILKYHEYSGTDISEYADLIASVIEFYNAFYPRLDSNGKRILFPSTALETFHAVPCVNKWGKEGVEAADYSDRVAVTNPSDVIAALDTTLRAAIRSHVGTSAQKQRWKEFLEQLPPIPTCQKDGYTVIAPCETPEHPIIGNCELPQLYPVYPYEKFGVGRPNRELAVRTYQYGWDIWDQLLPTSWHQNGIFAARLGLTDEARKYMWLKLADSGRKFPAFWGPGHDYVPDHNWGGSGMIGVQEMLMQVVDGQIYLLPAWPEDVDVSFKLWADRQTWIEAEYRNGKLSYQIHPAERECDVRYEKKGHQI
ncbi:MAG: DUF5703 domain-containing protein [Candidatus Merdivicinus sp.]|jgi:hypothetical protein